MKAVKLLGGPLHGQRMMVPSDTHDRVRVPVISDPKLLVAGSPIEPQDFTEIIYRRRSILGSEVWVPSVMRDAQIIEILVNHYERD